MVQSDTQVTNRIGADYIDFWAELARETKDPEAYYSWAHCYEKTGELSEGLIVINEMLKLSLDSEWQARAIFLKAIFQMDTPNAAWATIKKASLDVSPLLRGRIHSQRGRIKKELREYDKAILEYTAAQVYWEGNGSLLGHTWNNLAGLYIKKGLYEQAREAVDTAIHLWQNDQYLPHAYDQKSQIFLEEKRYEQALKYSRKSFVGIGDKHRWRAEFLCTLAECLAGTDKYDSAFKQIEEAFKIADFLASPDLRMFVAKHQKQTFQIMYERSDIYAIELALNISHGEKRLAARKLGIQHSALHGAMRRRKIKNATLK